MRRGETVSDFNNRAMRIIESYEKYDIVWKYDRQDVEFIVLGLDGIYFSGHIKADGCTDINHGDMCFHLCGASDIKEYFKMIEHIYRKAFDLMGRPDECDWDDPEAGS